MTTLDCGSQWHRWDPHIHTPETALSDQFGKRSWGDYVRLVNESAPRITALGVTDYFTLEGYKKVRERWLNKEFPHLRFVFPNVEVRLTIRTDAEQGVNLHLLFSPEDDDHIDRIDGMLGTLTYAGPGGEHFECNYKGLVRLGWKHLGAAKPMSQLTLDEKREAFCAGANQYKVSVEDLEKALRSPWFKQNCLIALPANKHGSSGLRKDDTFTTLRKRLQYNADVIFSGNPSDRSYWLGEGADSVATLRKEYRGPKPCLHGSDAHRLTTMTPDKDRYCWLKTTPSWDGLRQTLVEPEERVFIGKEPPPRARNVISSVALKGGTWVPKHSIALNEGLVAIIGPRGSGKTALADILAAGTESYEAGAASFLAKAQEELGRATVEVSWQDGAKGNVTRLAAAEPGEYPHARYLSQQFVERLCAADGASEALITEVEAVIFDALAPEDRLGAGSFEELRALETQGILNDLEAARERVRQLTTDIAREQEEKHEIEGLTKKKASLIADIEGAKRAIGVIVVAKGSEKAAELQAVQQQAEVAEKRVTALRQKQLALQNLRREVERLGKDAAGAVARLSSHLTLAGISLQGERDLFSIVFQGDVSAIITRHETAVKSCLESEQRAEAGLMTHAALSAKLKAIEASISEDATKRKQVELLGKKLTSAQTELKRCETKLATLATADERIRQLQDTRLAEYDRIVQLLDQEDEVLNRLYAPLAAQLQAGSDQQKKLAFRTRRRIDLREWVARGEEIFDLRRSTWLRTDGALDAFARDHFVAAWRGKATPATPASGAIREFIRKFKNANDMLATLKQTVTPAELAEWLFDTSHVDVTYGISYDGVALENLSPGSRGSVLLLLYLSVDQSDDRPLIIDQPEENLDPRSIFTELVPHFRSARARRQVIMVTHNANLVVNTDADQVIVASSSRVTGEALPRLSYMSGGLENNKIRQEVCRILEGGEDAFLQRERRYGLTEQRLAEDGLRGASSG